MNLKGAFLTLREALFQLRRQGTGGSIVLVSTKNVFAPGAEFGAYSASKAGAHQLARVAALEGAAIGVRVNMINADAVFGDPGNPSGLWQEVGPARAKARGIAAEELDEYYRNRNLLKARVTPEHVGTRRGLLRASGDADDRRDAAGRRRAPGRVPPLVLNAIFIALIRGRGPGRGVLGHDGRRPIRRRSTPRRTPSWSSRSA